MKFYLDTIGCRLNQSEIERYALQLRTAGHTLVGNPADADIAIVNTCMVTAAASADSRKKIRNIARAGTPQIVATGCWATLQPEQAKALPNISQVIHNKDKDNLVSIILQLKPEIFDKEFIAREPIPGLRARTRAFIKVQDGCNNKCTFCVTTIARGESVSRNEQEILKDIHAALAGGSKEIVLTGVHLGAWGQDFPKPKHLKELVQLILKETDVPRLRLSSLEPWELNETFFDLWEDSRLARHLHLPLQSGCKETLRRMARKITPQAFSHLLKIARDAVPDIAITTDIIVGFPGESDEEFEESLAFVRSQSFAGGHVFAYSPRPFTAAATMPNQVETQIKKTRSKKMREVFSQSAQRYRERFIGRTLNVLWESENKIDTNRWMLKGLSDNYLRITAQSPKPLWNQITSVKLVKLTENGIDGNIIYKGT